MIDWDKAFYHVRFSHCTLSTTDPNTCRWVLGRTYNRGVNWTQDFISLSCFTLVNLKTQLFGVSSKKSSQSNRRNLWHIFPVAEQKSSLQRHPVSLYVRTCNSPVEQHQSEQLLKAGRSPRLLLWMSMTWCHGTIPHRPYIYVCIYIWLTGLGFGRYMVGWVTLVINVLTQIAWLCLWVIKNIPLRQLSREKKEKLCTVHIVYIHCHSSFSWRPPKL